MGGFLKFVAAIYLIFVWVVAILSMGNASSYAGSPLAVFVIAVGLSVPAAIMFGFGQIIEGVAEMNAHLAVIREFFESGRPSGK